MGLLMVEYYLINRAELLKSRTFLNVSIERVLWPAVNDLSVFRECEYLSPLMTKERNIIVEC